MFDQVDLVDDIHQVAGLYHAPEDAVYAQAQFPFPVAEGAGKEDVRLAKIEMGSTGVRAVVAEEGGHVEDAARFVFQVEVGLRDESARMGPLPGEKGGPGKPPAFRAQPAREVDFGDPGLGARGSRMHRDGAADPDHADCEPQ